MKKQYDVAAYVWPAYTGKESRAKIFWPHGEGEWQTVRNAVGKFEGHNWPRTPYLGYSDEAEPETMEAQIDIASEYGVNVFIYDWYWYDRRPFLEQCLNDGFLTAKNNHKMKFYLMWANHDAMHLWDIRNSDDEETCVWRGDVDQKEFEKIAKRMIHLYFSHPCYYKIEGKPVLSIYDFNNLLKGLGGPEGVRDAFSWFRAECVRFGFPGLHIQTILQNPHIPDLSGINSGGFRFTAENTKFFNIDSLTHYQYVHFSDIDRHYLDILTDVEEEWQILKEEMNIPYFPHVSIGWDNNPRFKKFKPGIMRENTPKNIRKALIIAKQFIDSSLTQAPLITINSWNEWTESSYLLPDDLNGFGYLNAINQVFNNKTNIFMTKEVREIEQLKVIHK